MFYPKDPDQTGEPVLQEEGEGQRHDEAAHQLVGRHDRRYVIFLSSILQHKSVNLRPSMSE